MQQAKELVAPPTAEVSTHPLPRKGRIAMSTIMLILAATVLGVVGQMLLKQGMTQMGPLSLTISSTARIIWSIATSPLVIGGLLIYAIGTFFWLITLSRLELSVAYPFVSLNHVVIFLLAWLVLKEQISPLRAVGVVIICAGMLLVARS